MSRTIPSLWVVFWSVCHSNKTVTNSFNLSLLAPSWSQINFYSLTQDTTFFSGTWVSSFGDEHSLILHPASRRWGHLCSKHLWSFICKPYVTILLKRTKLPVGEGFLGTFYAYTFYWISPNRLNPRHSQGMIITYLVVREAMFFSLPSLFETLKSLTFQPSGLSPSPYYLRCTSSFFEFILLMM